MRRPYLPILTLLLLLTACHKARQGARTPASESRLDSLMYAIYDERYKNPEHAIVMTDSLQLTGDLTPNMADECRAEIYDAMNQPKTSAYYAEKSLKDGMLYEEDPPSFYAAYRLLSHININNLNWEKALHYATLGMEFAKQDTLPISKSYELKFLSQIGSCQIMLGQTAEGNGKFREACDRMEEHARQLKRFDHFYNMFIVISNCIECNLTQNNIKEAMDWLPRLEATYNTIVQAPDLKEDREVYATQCLEANKALVLAKAGMRKEAERSYRHFLKIVDKDDNDFVGTQVSYLQTMGKWDELADLTAYIDQSHPLAEKKLTMDFLRLDLAPKFTAELKSGRTAKALATATRIVNSLDTIYARALKDEAAQLAIVYETQEKEETIARQEASIREQSVTMSRFRLLVLTGTLLLILVFLTLFMLHRHRAAKKLQAAHEELKIAYARAEESSRMKTNFIQQISHEIRTPLNILSGFTQVITSPGIELDEPTKQNINHQITENTERITGLVNKMLELSDASSKTVIAREDSVPAVQIAAQAVEDSGIAQAPHVNFELKTDEAVETLSVTTNLGQATRALSLLLDNARKFTRQAEAHHRNEAVAEKATVRLLVSRHDGMLRFTVEDTGIGVPPSEAEHIFEEFVQLDEYYDGTGIGLSIARSIARRMGGDIVLDTSYSPGARFVMDIPIG